MKRAVLLDAFRKHLHNKWDVYAIKFMACEQANFLMLIFVWFLTDRFLKGQVIKVN